MKLLSPQEQTGTRWLPALVLAYIVACFALHPFSPLTTHHLFDPDDYMRLHEVMNWLQGQGWYDLSVPRLSPGGNTVVHWARLLDVPIAVIAQPFVPLMGLTNAVLAAGLIVPLLWLVLLLFLLPALARPFTGAARAPVACVMFLFAPLLLFNYTPGRVDHHGVQAIIAGFALLCLHHMLRDVQARLFAFFAALAFACGFWIGAEALPWAILFIACLGIAAAWTGGRIARAAAWFGLFLPLCVGTMLAAAVPVAAFSSTALSWFSSAYVLFAALAGGALILGCLLGSLPLLGNRFVRLIVYTILGLGAGVAFFWLVPGALHGPFADYDAFDATTALENISEAQPLSHALSFNRFVPMSLLPVLLTFLRLLALPFAGFAVCVWQMGRDEEKMGLWATQAVFLGASTALTFFWQMRVGIFMELFALTPLTFALGAWWDHLRWGLWDRRLFWAEIAVFMVLGFAPVVLLPALVAHKPLYPDIVLFPAARDAPACPLEPVLPFLNDAPKPLTIMNNSDNGPQLLFETQHKVIAGNFDVAGNADAYSFFHAVDDSEAIAAAHKWQADTVLICKKVPSLYLGKDYYAPAHMRLQTGADGMLHYLNADTRQPLIERLTRGQIPAWLKPIEIPAASDYLMFHIDYPAGKK